MVLKEKSTKFKKGIVKKVSTLKKSLSTPKTRRLVILALIIMLLLIAFSFTKSLFIAALVNGKPITRISLVKNLEKQGGQQALDGLITKEIIFQEAKKKNIQVTDAEIEKEIDKIKKVVEEQGTTLEVALSIQGQTEEDLKDNIYISKTIEKLFGDEIEVLDDEVSNYYNTNKSVFEDKKLEEVKDQIKDQLLQQKLSAKFQEWIVEVKGNANIKYLVNF